VINFLSFGFKHLIQARNNSGNLHFEQE
jgi:hypothetical protein